MAKRKPFDPAAIQLSRSALEEFVRCPLCFYLHRRLGISPPRMVPLTLAVATDALLKNEFDAVRVTGANHPVWVREGLDVRAFVHPELETWRSNFKGQRVTHAATGAVISGAVDDLWVDQKSGLLYVVDYKSTSKQGEPTIESEFGLSYKRQMEIYQWLFRTAGFNVSPTAYFLYVNGSKQGGFYPSGVEGVMRFETTLIAYQGNSGWVDGVITHAVACLQNDVLPEAGAGCDNCRYFSQRTLGSR